MTNSVNKLWEMVIKCAMEAYGVDLCEVMRGKSEVCSDARYVVVAIMSKVVPDKEIARRLGITRQGVTFIRNNSAKGRKRMIKAVIDEINAVLSGNVNL